MLFTIGRLARGWGATLAAIIGSLVLLAGTASPAAAAETDWSNVGGSARAYSGIYSVTINGATYEVTRGTDNNVWFRYNGGNWNPLGGDQSSRTTSPPRIIEWPAGRAMVLVRGLDGEIWYSQVNSGSANFWAPWVRLPAGAAAIGAPLPTVVAGGLFIDTPNQYRQISVLSLYMANGVVTPVGGWRVSSHAVLSTNARDIEGDSQIAVYGTERYNTVMRSFITGTDHHVWMITSDASGGNTTVTQVDGAAVCDSGVGAARQGNPNTVVSPGQSGYAGQQRVLISCIGSDGYVWESLSTDGGLHFGAWTRPAGSPAPSQVTPAVNATANSFTINIRWDGTRSGAFPDNSIVGKRIN
ncbi:hypothetical protein OG233_24660 [Streptomyces sp. NBC_01218]|uniref:hypothetical protein n=1 Tax=unclassified Streptomyces TaxID=2593676 RepID=UPI0023B8A303|nr:MULTISPECIES: hypothetical protein [unclassified Streptomyces]WEH42460.1 hypothetical protein PZB77_24820 [Streptomyces sp. AM 2-1-1]WSQ54083.1 hypothetical protein OG233_24660 [Streptomyces sp. NBC_01218]